MNIRTYSANTTSPWLCERSHASETLPMTADMVLRVCMTCALALLAGFAWSLAHAHDAPSLRGELATAETRVAVEAGEHAPRLTQMQLRGAPAWRNLASEPLPDHIDIDGAPQAVTWHLDRAAARFESDRIVLVYLADRPALKAVWQWQARTGHGPIEHSITIANLSQQSVLLPLLPSFRFAWQIDPASPLERFWVEKGADTPSPEGVHLDRLRDGDVWENSSSTYARPIAGKPREMIPYVLIEEPAGRRRGWYVGIEFSGRTRITVHRQESALTGEAGLDPAPAPYRTRLAPDGIFATPTIFIGAFSGGPDGAGNIVRRWVRAALNNPRTVSDPTYPDLVNNSWGSGMAVDETLARRMITDSAELGLEMFHLDAGWFRDVGDWQADPVKFPHGIANVADFAHSRGLKFGLWADWTQAGTSTLPGALNVSDPTVRDWLIADPPAGWKHVEPFKGITIDLGVPAAKAWAAAELERMVSTYHLDMLEHDGYLVAQGSTRDNHPAVPPDPDTARIYEDSGFLWADGSNSTDVSYHATRAYYELYEQLRAHHPHLLLEVCNDGGRMMDFGSAAHGDYFSVTDSYDPLSNRRAFYDASYVFPPAMLESYVKKWPAPRIENFRYALRSGMLGWFSLMLDTSQWTTEQRTDARRQFALYKSALRPLIRDADLYHVAGRPDGIHWDGTEYYSQTRRQGVLYAFRGSSLEDSTHRFRLSGLRSARRYRLKFHDRGAAATMDASGQALMQQGIKVTLDLPLSSELIFFQELP